MRGFLICIINYSITKDGKIKIITVSSTGNKDVHRSYFTNPQIDINIKHFKS